MASEQTSATVPLMAIMDVMMMAMQERMTMAVVSIITVFVIIIFVTDSNGDVDDNDDFNRLATPTATTRRSTEGIRRGRKS